MNPLFFLRPAEIWTQYAPLLLLWMSATFIVIPSLTAAGTSLEKPTPDSVQARIEAADTVRSRFENGELRSEITLYRDGNPIETNQYAVQFNANGDSRVKMLDTRSKGQKVLLLRDAMWLFVPRTRKAIRITPMQRSMGQASYGDVASLRWAKEYRWDGEPLLTETQANPDQADQILIRIGLAADRQSATYRRITLWLDARNNYPVKADFYLASGKRMKSAEYQIEPLNGQPFVRTTRFLTPGKQREYTLMKTSDPVEKQYPASLFTRQGFVR